MSTSISIGYLPLEISSKIQDFARPLIPTLQTRKNWKQGSKSIIALRKHPNWYHISEDLKSLSTDENRQYGILLYTLRQYNFMEKESVSTLTNLDKFSLVISFFGVISGFICVCTESKLIKLF